MARWIWAVNPFTDESTFFRRCLETVERWGRLMGARIEPVFVLPPPAFLPPVEIGLLPLEDAWSRAGEELVKRFPSSPHGVFETPKVLAAESGFVRGQARAIDEHAQLGGADGIVVATHGRRGLSRLFLGSFAETLLHQATLPVLVVRPSEILGRRIRRVVLPMALPFTDAAGFDEATELAKSQGAKLILYHKVDYLLEHQLYLPSGALEGAPGIYDLSARREELRRWIERASARGVPVEGRLDKGTGAIADGILRQAGRLGADLVMMTPQAGPVEAALVGSVARRVLRESPCPVLLRPGKKANVSEVPIVKRMVKNTPR